MKNFDLSSLLFYHHPSNITDVSVYALHCPRMLYFYSANRTVRRRFRWLPLLLPTNRIIVNSLSDVYYVPPLVDWKLLMSWVS